MSLWACPHFLDMCLRVFHLPWQNLLFTVDSEEASIFRKPKWRLFRFSGKQLVSPGESDGTNRSVAESQRSIFCAFYNPCYLSLYLSVAKILKPLKTTVSVKLAALSRPVNSSPLQGLRTPITYKRCNLTEVVQDAAIHFLSSPT